MKYQLFGFPLWYGKVGKRQAKKALNKSGLWYKFKTEPKMRNATLGFVVNDCTQFNHKVIEIEPVYYRCGKGYVLIAIDITCENGPGCSLVQCGVKSALSRDEIESKHLAFTKSWGLGERGKTWYGNEYSEHKERFEKVVQLLESGGHICDENGFLLDEFKRSMYL